MDFNWKKFNSVEELMQRHSSSGWKTLQATSVADSVTKKSMSLLKNSNNFLSKTKINKYWTDNTYMCNVKGYKFTE